MPRWYTIRGKENNDPWRNLACHNELGQRPPRRGAWLPPSSGVVDAGELWPRRVKCAYKWRQNPMVVVVVEGFFSKNLQTDGQVETREWRAGREEGRRDEGRDWMISIRLGLHNTWVIPVRVINCHTCRSDEGQQRKKQHTHTHTHTLERMGKENGGEINKFIYFF